MFWVLYDVRTTQTREAALFEPLIIRTYPTPVLHRFYSRLFEITGAEGERIAQASTLWLLMDIHTRRMSFSTAVQHNMEAVMSTPPPVTPRPEPVRLPEGVEERQERVPVYSDFDLNGHVNNARYISWMCDALGMDRLRGRRFASLHANYRAEIRPGATALLRLVCAGDAFGFEVTSGGQVCFLCDGTLQPTE
jgi:acyl-ACP thioesterase